MKGAAVGTFVAILLVVVLAFCWFAGEQVLRTKLIFTVLTVVSFGLCLIPSDSLGWFILAGQAVLAMVIGGSTFGAGWLGRRH